MIFLRLTEAFGLPGTENYRDTYSTAEEAELMDSIGVNGEIGNINPQTMIAQTK